MNRSTKTKPSSQACLSCRSKHLKCDGRTPVCARCARYNLRCTFVQSRRGYKGNGTGSSLDTSAASDSQRDVPLDFAQGSTYVSDETISVPAAEHDNVDDDHLIEVYYQFVHPAHPFLLPRSAYLQDQRIFPQHLRSAIYFIASHYANRDSEKYRQRSKAVFDPNTPEDGFKVQSMILLTITSYARFERDLGNRALCAAVDLALRLGLDSNTFASDQTEVYRESWRRTWWELYSISGLISLISGADVKLKQPLNLPLPTHCELYEAQRESPFRFPAEMQQRFSVEGTFQWSSFAYRIEAIRILNSVLDITNDPHGVQCDAANASIWSFLLSLPPDKREGLNEDGEIDEVMFCALIAIHLASICLHLPRSNLASLRSFKTVCGNDCGKVSSEQSRIHQNAASKSARAISKSISSRTSLKTLSPCFSCAIAFAAAVQLSECLVLKPTESVYLKEHIQLELTALNVLGETWPIARVIRGQIAQFTREVLGHAAQDQSSDPFPQPAILDEQWLRDLIADDLEVPSGIFIPGM